MTINPVGDLREPWLKIERAEQHVKDFNREIKSFHASNPYEIFFEKDAQTGYVNVKARRLREFPNLLSLIASDAIHNTRASLDYLACQLALRNGADNTENVYFPFAKSREDFYSSGIQRKTRKLSAADRAKITDFKPYLGGHDLLWALHDLDRSDKHVRLTTVGAASRNLGMRFKPNQKVDATIRYFKPHPFNEAGEIILCAFPPGTNFEGEIKPSIGVEFVEPAPVKGEPVGGTLQYFVDLATRIIAAFQ